MFSYFLPSILPTSIDAETAATVYVTVQATSDGTGNVVVSLRAFVYNPRNGGRYVHSYMYIHIV